MVCTAEEFSVVRILPVALKGRVFGPGALCGFHEDKGEIDGVAIYVYGTEIFPIKVLLIVRDIYAVYGIAGRETDGVKLARVPRPEMPAADAVCLIAKADQGLVVIENSLDPSYE